MVIVPAGPPVRERGEVALGVLGCGRLGGPGEAAHERAQLVVGGPLSSVVTRRHVASRAAAPGRLAAASRCIRRPVIVSSAASSASSSGGRRRVLRGQRHPATPAQVGVHRQPVRDGPVRFCTAVEQAAHRGDGRPGSLPRRGQEVPRPGELCVRAGPGLLQSRAASRDAAGARRGAVGRGQEAVDRGGDLAEHGGRAARRSAPGRPGGTRCRGRPVRAAPRRGSRPTAPPQTQRAAQRGRDRAQVLADGGERAAGRGAPWRRSGRRR